LLVPFLSLTLFFSDQVSSLTEQLRNMSMTSSNNDANHVMRSNRTAESNETKSESIWYNSNFFLHVTAQNV